MDVLLIACLLLLEKLLHSGKLAGLLLRTQRSAISARCIPAGAYFSVRLYHSRMILTISSAVCSGRRRWCIPSHTHVTFGGKEGNRLAAPVARMNANSTEMNSVSHKTRRSRMAVARDDIRKQLSSSVSKSCATKMVRFLSIFGTAQFQRGGGIWEVVSIWLLLNPLKNPLFPRSSSCACQSMAIMV